MTDRDLLELAAKAAGYRIRVSNGGSFSIDLDDHWVSWNPLRDDGDALRLAASLDMRVDINGGAVRIVDSMDNEHFLSGAVQSPAWKMAVIRNAIVRVAVEVGKATE